jgi:cob(I)alamin adenosyltransferase|tara:strand:- start:219 stop:842 length:624 start_codon:yes stop_codon:yes gene_type:complete
MTKKKFKDPSITISKVYTKTGDTGKTSLVGGQKVLKSNIRIHAYGEIDELNSIVGLCIEELKLLDYDFKILIQSLYRIQNDLFNLGTILATKPEDMMPSMPRITIQDIDILEQEIDKSNKDLPILHSFILPGGSKINAFFHLARTVCRRCERICCDLFEQDKTDKIVISYLNRLSDAFFVWSRLVSKLLNHEENMWEPNKGSSNQSN